MYNACREKGDQVLIKFTNFIQSETSKFSKKTKSLTFSVPSLGRYVKYESLGLYYPHLPSQINFNNICCLDSIITTLVTYISSFLLINVAEQIHFSVTCLQVLPVIEFLLLTMLLDNV